MSDDTELDPNDERSRYWRIRQVTPPKESICGTIHLGYVPIIKGEVQKLWPVPLAEMSDEKKLLARVKAHRTEAAILRDALRRCLPFLALARFGQDPEEGAKLEEEVRKLCGD